jgi:hypothetical protein
MVKTLMTLSPDAFEPAKPIAGGRRVRRVTVRVLKSEALAVTLTKHLLEKFGGASFAEISTAWVEGRGYLRLKMLNLSTDDTHAGSLGAKGQMTFRVETHPFKPEVIHGAVECDFTADIASGFITVECPDWEQIFEEAKAEEEGYA